MARSGCCVTPGGQLEPGRPVLSHIGHGPLFNRSRCVSRIESATKRIAASPRIGGATRKPGFLQFPVGTYLIVYEVGNDEVIVHYVRHGARPRPWEGERRY
jgi:plasmid stabilization system protein ParE